MLLICRDTSLVMVLSTSVTLGGDARSRWNLIICLLYHIMKISIAFCHTAPGSSGHSWVRGQCYKNVCHGLRGTLLFVLLKSWREEDSAESQSWVRSRWTRNDRWDTLWRKDWARHNYHIPRGFLKASATRTHGTAWHSREIHVFSKSSLNRLLLDCVALLGMDICSMGLLSCSLRGKHCIFMALHGQTSNWKKGTGSPHGLHKEEMGHDPSPPFFRN